jgi:hypothetical protein
MRPAESSRLISLTCSNLLFRQGGRASGPHCLPVQWLPQEGIVCLPHTPLWQKPSIAIPSGIATEQLWRAPYEKHRAKADIIGICRELKGAMQGASDKALLERARQAWEDTMRLLGRPEAYGQVLAVACAALRETTLDV